MNNITARLHETGSLFIRIKSDTDRMRSPGAELPLLLMAFPFMQVRIRMK